MSSSSKYNATNMSPYNIHDFNENKKRLAIYQKLKPKEVKTINKILQKTPYFCTIPIHNCKNQTSQCHKYFEQKNGKVNVCRTGVPCKSKAKNILPSIQYNGELMNKICTNFINHRNKSLSKFSKKIISNSSKRSTKDTKKKSKTTRKKNF